MDKNENEQNKELEDSLVRAVADAAVDFMESEERFYRSRCLYECARDPRAPSPFALRAALSAASSRAGAENDEATSRLFVAVKALKDHHK